VILRYARRGASISSNIAIPSSTKSAPVPPTIFMVVPVPVNASEPEPAVAVLSPDEPDPPPGEVGGAVVDVDEFPDVVVGPPEVVVVDADVVEVVVA
jgi:hypothetical protein